MKKLATLAATAGLAATISTAASAFTANDLMPACRAFMTRNNQVEVYGGRYAIGYCAGVVPSKVTLEQAGTETNLDNPAALAFSQAFCVRPSYAT